MSISAVSQYHSQLAQYRPPSFEADVPLNTGAPRIVQLSPERLAELSAETRSSEAVQNTPGFSQMVEGFVKGVNTSITTSESNERDLMVGKTHDTGAVVASAEEANLELSLAISVQKKAIQAYQTLSQMQF